MATTGRAAVADTSFAELVESQVLEELRPANTTRGFLRFAAKGPSRVASFPIWDDIGPADSLTNGDDLTDLSTLTDAMTDSEQSATAAEQGQAIFVSDLAKEVNVSNLLSEASRMLARGIAEQWESDLAALMDDFSNVTTAGSTLTPVDLLAAVSALEQRDIPGPYVGYLDPKQTGELRAEIATTTASYEVGGRNADLVRPFGVSGEFGVYMGIPIYQSSLTVPTASLIGGAVFQAGAALGCYELWGPRIETQRDASARVTEFVGTQCYGFKEIHDTRGQTIKSAE